MYQINNVNVMYAKKENSCRNHYNDDLISDSSNIHARNSLGHTQEEKKDRDTISI